MTTERNKLMSDQWKRALAALMVIASILTMVACSPKGPGSAVSAEQRAAAEKALQWLYAQQKQDGSFDAGFGHPAGLTCDVVLAVVAAGGDPAEWSAATGQPTMIDYLASNGLEYTVDAATTGKLIVALAAAGLDPRDFVTDWVAHLHSFANASGAYDPASVGQAWTVLALRAAGEKVPPTTVEVLKGYQLDTGAWASAFGPDNDTVSYALQALVAANEAKSSPVIQKALAFLHEQQNDDGGFPAIKPSEWGTDSNANSTANVIMALLAVGEDPTSDEWTKPAGNPMSALLSLQAEDGRIEFQPGVGEPLLSTVQAIPALMNQTLPIPAR
jgi:prenyltransferase beta subunit